MDPFLLLRIKQKKKNQFKSSIKELQNEQDKV